MSAICAFGSTAYAAVATGAWAISVVPVPEPGQTGEGKGEHGTRDFKDEPSGRPLSVGSRKRRKGVGCRKDPKVESTTQGERGTR